MPADINIIPVASLLLDSIADHPIKAFAILALWLVAFAYTINAPRD